MSVLIFLFVASAAAPSPSPSPAPAPDFYVAPLRRMSVRECTKLLSDCPECTVMERAALRVNYGVRCKREPDLRDVARECRAGYHLERQMACYGYGAAEIPTARMVCHADSQRGADRPCGVECAWDTKMLPPAAKTK